MIYVKRDIRDDELLQVIRGWIDVLSQKRYDDFFDALGYFMGGESASAELIKSDLSRYRSSLYPGISEFEVTSWSTAQDGNPCPVAEVVWYIRNESRLAGAVTFTLPLNGMWSDVSADFVLFETDAEEGFLLKLEEISIPIQN